MLTCKENQFGLLSSLKGILKLVAGFKYGKKHFAKIVTSLIKVLLKNLQKKQYFKPTYN